MMVEIQLVNEKGRGIPALERRSMQRYRGALHMLETRSQALGRIVPTALLLSSTDGTQSPLLPALQDAKVIFMRDAQMRIRGFELIEGIQYGQTWDVGVKSC